MNALTAPHCWPAPASCRVRPDRSELLQLARMVRDCDLSTWTKCRMDGEDRTAAAA